MANRRDKCGNTSKRCSVPALSGRPLLSGVLQRSREIPSACQHHRVMQKQPSSSCSASTTMVISGPPPAPRPHWSRASPNVALLLLSSLSHQFHPYTGVGDRQDRVVTGTPSPAPFPGRAGADMGGTPGTLEGWGPLSTLTPQGFKNEVTGDLCKKRRGRFLGHFCYNTRRARHGLEEWDILILR